MTRVPPRDPRRTPWLDKVDEALGEGARIGGLGPEGSEAISRAVREGYRLIEDNIRQGRDIGQRFRSGEYAASEAPADARRALRRVIRAGRDFTEAWFQLLESAVGMEGSTRAGSGAAAGGAASDPASPAAPADLWPPLYTPAPVFYPTPRPPAAAPALDGPSLRCEFSGGEGSAEPCRLVRPATALRPASQLEARWTGSPAPAPAVSFDVDLATFDVVAQVHVEGVPAGAYAAEIWQAVPAGEPQRLGLLSLTVSGTPSPVADSSAPES